MLIKKNVLEALPFYQHKFPKRGRRFCNNYITRYRIMKTLLRKIDNKPSAVNPNKTIKYSYNKLNGSISLNHKISKKKTKICLITYKFFDICQVKYTEHKRESSVMSVLIGNKFSWRLEKQLYKILLIQQKTDGSIVR